MKLAIHFIPDNTSLYERLGDSYLALKNEEVALAYYRQAIQINPVDTSCRAKVGDIYLARGDEKKAMEQYRAATDLDLSNIPSHYQLAEHYKSIRDWKDAKREYLTILAVDPEQQPQAHKEVALIFERDDEMGQALYHWNKYLERVPTDLDAKQHVIDIRKPMLTKKQAEQVAQEDKAKAENLGQAVPTKVPPPSAPNLTVPDTSNIPSGPVDQVSAVPVSVVQPDTSATPEVVTIPK